MNVEANRTQASLHALQFLVSELIKSLPQERQDEILDAAKRAFTGHRPDHDTDALVVVYAALGKPGEWRDR